jgi:hypothetical protein
MDTSDLQRFLELRTKPIQINGAFHRNFEVPCSALKDGRCVLYDVRPDVCRDFVPGSLPCFNTVRGRRTREQYDAIKEASDTNWDGTPQKKNVVDMSTVTDGLPHSDRGVGESV